MKQPIVRLRFLVIPVIIILLLVGVHQYDYYIGPSINREHSARNYMTYAQQMLLGMAYTAKHGKEPLPSDQELLSEAEVSRLGLKKIDPWGNLYRYIWDKNLQGMVHIGGSAYATQAVVYSIGPNRIDEFWKGDDIAIGLDKGNASAAGK